MPKKEDVARAVAAAATAVHSPRPSAVYSLKDENTGSRLQKLQHHVSKVLKGFSQPSEVRRGTYNPEVLTSQKRQWASFQMQYLDHRSFKEPSRLFERVVVVGLPPSCDVQALQRQYVTRRFEVLLVVRIILVSNLASNLRSYLFTHRKSSCHLNAKIFFHFASLEA
ncbi:hypothetical protein V6N13_002446 [Hibiscus sabdariffa]